ncbi:MAG: hypothetical protein ACE5EF_09040 [Dehalococcoidia bacterium]
MRTANYIFSTTSFILGLGIVLFVLTQADEFHARTILWPPDWSIGTTIGVVLMLNGVVRLWFAAGEADGSPPDTPYTR